VPTGTVDFRIGDRLGSGVSTIVDFERHRRQVSSAAVAQMKATLMAAGVECIEENGGDPGLRLGKRS